jgi:hypothetical protein
VTYRELTWAGEMTNYDQQLVAIGRFLEKITRQVERGTLCNLIVYYVGHGYFAGSRQEYHVALACLEMGYASTGLKVTELAEVLKERARSFRHFVILDCCFAAEALREFQGAADDAIYAKAKGAFAEDTLRRPQQIPRRGTALYCAADKDSVARSPKELPHTMFTDALLSVLRSGDAQFAQYLTLAEVQSLAWERLQGYPNPVRPVLHSPDQTEGDIAAIVGLFPNLALSRSAMAAAPSVQAIVSPVVMPEPPPALHVHATSPTASPKPLGHELVMQVLHQLTKLVGPIAPIIVNKARKQATDFASFIQAIAERLDDKERRHFLEAMETLRRAHGMPAHPHQSK